MSARALSLAIAALMITTLVAPPAWGAQLATPAWDASGTRWDASTSLDAEERDRFYELWTVRFMDSASLNAYLATPGLFDDGYNHLPENEKAALVVGLIHYWQDTIPGFGRDFWTGVAAEDQKSFEQLAMMMYATIFAKDEFLASLRESVVPAAQTYGPPVSEDAGHPEFPGLSQDDIVAQVEALHLTQSVVSDPPAFPDLGVPPHVAGAQGALVRVPAMPALGLEPLPVDPVNVEEATSVLELQDLLDLVPRGVTTSAAIPPDPNELLNLVAGGTYVACGSVGAGPVRCAPVPAPLGVPVALDLDGDLLTGVAGAEVTVLLGPTVNPAYAATGFATLLRVDRTAPSASPLWTPLPAQAFVVYTVPGAATQVMAGFDARSETLGDTQEVRVTLTDLAMALTGDIRLVGELTRAGPGSTLTLLTGYAQINPVVFPPVPTDPATVALRFDPVPSSLVAELHFANLAGQTIIEGGVDASLSPTVTAAIDIARGDSRRSLVGVVESMPTSIDFRIVSEAVGAVGLDYSANAPFPRFELHDVLTPDVGVPSSYSTLDAVVHDVPQTIHFGIDRPFNVEYVASSEVTDATVVITQRDAQGIVSSMGATAVGIPAAWTLDGSTSPISITYTASAALDSIGAVMQQRAPSGGMTTYTATIASIPRWLQIRAASNEIVVDARSSASGAIGSGQIGSIAAQYTTDGVFIGGVGNHANVVQTPAVTRASIGYSGLQYLRVNQAGDNLLVDVRNTAPRYFTASANMPEAYVSVIIDSIPSHVTVTATGTTFVYDAYGANIRALTVDFWDKESMEVIATLRDIPGRATMNVNLPGSAITYSATSTIGALEADAWVGAWYGRLRLTGIPTAWSASFGGGTYAFDALPYAISTIDAAVTNHGWWTSLSGNHLNLDYVASSGATDASFRMTAVQRALYSRSGANQNVDLRMGGGTPFTAVIEAALANGERAYAFGSFSPLPSSIQVSLGEKFTATTNQNFDTYLYGEYGTPTALANAPTPPYVHGFSIRDGASGLSKAIKGQLYLTGLPTSVSFDSRNATFGFTNWRPASSTLYADAELDNVVSTPVDLYVSQSGIPNPQSLAFAMSSADIGGGAKRVRVDLTQTAGMGALWADLTSGTQHGRVTVSNIPDDIHATYTAANGQSTFAWDATAAISSVFAGFRVTTQSASFQGYVSLAQLPSDFTIVAGRASGGQGPTLTYNANADSLDVTAFTDASLFGGDLRARLSFSMTNLGRDADVFVSGTGIRFLSTPATTSIYTNVWATYNYYRSGSGVWDEGGFVEFPWAYHVGVTPTINNLAVTLSGISDFSMQWGVTSKLSGSYGSFSMGWNTFTVDLHAYGKVQIVVDWPWPFGSSTIDIVNLHYHPGTINIDVLFHKYTNHQAYWFGTSGWAICDWSLWMDVRPHPHGASWNGFSTSSATAEGGAWYVTPNPWGALPGWGIDLAARYTSPDGGGIGGPHFGYDCF